METLRHGYRVRAAVRSERKAEIVRSNPALKDIKSDQLDFVIIPDFLVDGAFDEAVKGVDFILHIASPIPTADLSGDDDLDALMIKPAIQATLGVLRSAQNANTVQRVVVTNSAVGIIPFTVIAGIEKTDTRFGPDHRCEPAPAPYMNNTQVAYTASKVLALKHAEDFMKSEKPSFDLIHIHPSVVLGPDMLVTKSKDLDSGSNAFAMSIVLGRGGEDAFPATITHVNTVALAHVRALDSNVPGNQSFLVSNTGDEGWSVCFDHSLDRFFSSSMRANLIYLPVQRYQRSRPEAFPRSRARGSDPQQWLSPRCRDPVGHQQDRESPWYQAKVV